MNEICWSTFVGNTSEILVLLDEAWSRHHDVAPIQRGEKAVYTIPVQREIGMRGEKFVRFFIRDESEIVCAYPALAPHCFNQGIEPNACPVCEGQGEIREAKIKSLNFLTYLCDECDSFWEKKEATCVERAQDFATFLKNHTLSWSDVTFLD